MNIQIKPELQAFIDPLSPAELDALERSLLAEGCRDALVLWGEVLVDGHNRYQLCRKHGLPFQTVQNPRLRSLEDVQLWMIDQQLGRRSVSDFQRGLLALRKKELVQARRSRPQQAEPQTPGSASTPAPELPPEPPISTREAVARAARIKPSQLLQIEKIQKQAAPEVVAAVKAGELSMAAAVAVASLPVEAQVAAASAGPAQLRQAAKQVREAKAASRPPKRSEADAAADGEPVPAGEADTLPALQQRVAALSAENAALRAELDQLRQRLLTAGAG